MRLITATILLLAIGNNSMCRVSNNDIELKSHSFYLSYEVGFEYFKANFPGITPIELDCYFDLTNNTELPFLMDFKYNNNVVNEFAADTAGDHFYTMSPGDTLIALMPLQAMAKIPAHKSANIPVKFPYRQSGQLREALSGDSLDEIAEKVSGMDFFFKRRTNGSQSIRADEDDLYIYFMFKDTAITCTQNGCGPFIDAATR